MQAQRTFCFYIDDSGSRDPDRRSSPQAAAHDWYALGGVIIDESLKDDADARIVAFRKRWLQMGDAPLHSIDIRCHKHAFRWLAEVSAQRKQEFMGELAALIQGLPIYVLACVIDRPGYNDRYLQTYGRRRWRLCKTAFSIAVERAAKFARAHDARLRVFVETSDKHAHRHLRGYYADLRSEGAPFNSATSEKYAPLAGESMRQTLLELQFKPKRSRLMQIADLVLWPVCKGRYDAGNRAYLALCDGGKLLDSVCNASNGLQGIKYFCFDLAEAPSG